MGPGMIGIGIGIGNGIIAGPGGAGTTGGTIGGGATAAGGTGSTGATTGLGAGARGAGMGGGFGAGSAGMKLPGTGCGCSGCANTGGSTWVAAAVGRIPTVTATASAAHPATRIPPTELPISRARPTGGGNTSGSSSPPDSS